MKPEQTIPVQEQGTEINVEESVKLLDNKSAKAFFERVKKRLLAIHQWKKWTGALSAGFALTDEHGQIITTSPRQGNYLKINIPAPGITSGGGFDWVRIEEIKEVSERECDFISIRVRPAPSPLNSNSDVAHFLTDEATSNFIVRRQGNIVTAGVYGRNEKPNVEAEDVVAKIRNAVTGTAAVGGFAKLQWKGLVNGLLKQ